MITTDELSENLSVISIVDGNEDNFVIDIKQGENYVTVSFSKYSAGNSRMAYIPIHMTLSEFVQLSQVFSNMSDRCGVISLPSPQEE